MPLISKADYQEQYYYYYSTQRNPSDWVQDNEYILIGVTTPQPSNETFDYYQYIDIVFNGEVNDNSELLYSIYAESTTGSKVFESGYFPANTPINVRSRAKTTATPYKFYVYVKRADGQPLSKNDMRSYALLRTTMIITKTIVEPVQTTAIPSDWLDNTTQTYQTVTTVTRPAAYDDLVGTVPVLSPDSTGTPPSWFDQYNPMEQPWFVDIIASLADFTEIVTGVSADMQIFWVFGGFVISGLLLAWLLH